MLVLAGCKLQSETTAESKEPNQSHPALLSRCVNLHKLIFSEKSQVELISILCKDKVLTKELPSQQFERINELRLMADSISTFADQLLVQIMDSLHGNCSIMKYNFNNPGDPQKAALFWQSNSTKNSETNAKVWETLLLQYNRKLSSIYSDLVTPKLELMNFELFENPALDPFISPGLWKYKMMSWEESNLSDITFGGSAEFVLIHQLGVWTQLNESYLMLLKNNID